MMMRKGITLILVVIESEKNTTRIVVGEGSPGLCFCLATTHSCSNCKTLVCDFCSPDAEEASRRHCRKCFSSSSSKDSEDEIVDKYQDELEEDLSHGKPVNPPEVPVTKVLFKVAKDQTWK